MAYQYKPDGTKYGKYVVKDPNIVLGIAGDDHERPAPRLRRRQLHQGPHLP